jgi:transcriptional regulator with XRE-family HTH domain
MARENPNALVAANVRRLRRQQGMSQEKLAEVAGLHRTYIGAIERGERNVTLNTLQQMAEALGVSCTALLTVIQHKRLK